MRALISIVLCTSACSPDPDSLYVGEAPVELTTQWQAGEDRARLAGADVCLVDGECVVADELGYTTFEVPAGADVALRVDAPLYYPAIAPLAAPKDFDDHQNMYLLRQASLDGLGQDPTLGLILLVVVGRGGLTPELDASADGPLFTDSRGVPRDVNKSLNGGFIAYINVEPGDTTLRLIGAEGCRHGGWLLNEADYRLPVEAGRTTFLPDLDCNPQ